MYFPHKHVWHERVADGGVDNATATATKAAGGARVRQVILAAIVAFDGDAQGKVFQIKDGTTIKIEVPILQSPTIIHAGGETPLLRGALNGAVSGVLAASGTAGVNGFVTLIGYTDPEA